jgi:hypothetical protein
MSIKDALAKYYDNFLFIFPGLILITAGILIVFVVLCIVNRRNRAFINKMTRWLVIIYTYIVICFIMTTVGGLVNILA